MGILTSALPPEVLAGTDWHRFIDAKHPGRLIELSTALFTEFRRAEKDNETTRAEFFKLVAAATSLRLTEGGKPVFLPMMVLHTENKRSPALEDFAEMDLQALAIVAEHAPSCLLRAHLADVTATAAVEVGANALWPSGALAASAYLELAEQHLLSERGTQVLTEFLRGLTLSRVYCRNDQTLRDRYWALAQKAVTHFVGNAAPAIAFVLIEPLRRGRPDLAAGLASELEQAAAEHLDKGLAENAARCFELASQLWQVHGSRPDAKRTRLAQGEALVSRAAQTGPGAMAKGMWLAEGIDVLRRAGADRYRVNELRRDLAHAQRQSLDDFKRIVHKTDVSEMVRMIEEAVKGPTLLDSLLQVAFLAWRWPAFDKVQQEVHDASQNYILSSLFSTQQLNNEGAVVAEDGPFNASDPDSVYAAMVRHNREIEFAFRADVVVLRCVDLLFVRHHPNLSSLAEMAHASPVVPPGHELSIARGLLAGINSDWLEAAVYLIPQVEPFVRHQLHLHDIITLARKDDGTESEKTLNELLISDDAERVLGRDLILDLQTLMVHPMGFSLRHRWAHGLATDHLIVNQGVLGLWWTVLRLVLWPWAADRNGLPEALTPVPKSDP
jgi:Domain of unknown function (DUF4209)